METFFLLSVISIGQENSPVGNLSLDPGFFLSKEVFFCATAAFSGVGP